MNFIELPMGVEYIINTLNACGFQGIIVGGCVRDAILKLVPKDWDLATDALPHQVKSLFARTYDTGIRHGTVTVVPDKENSYEITTFRTESGYSDCRHPDAVFYTKNPEEDLKRRDFTMNAIGYHPDKGFIDPFDGIGDINRRIIRGVGRPEERFCEDALRMLRAVRFAGQLGFDIEPNTWEAVKLNSRLIENVSAERVRDEFEKLLLSPRPEKLQLLNESRLILNFHSGLGRLLINQEDRLSCLSSVPVRLTLRLGLILEKAADAKGILTDLRFDNKTIKEVLILIWGLRQKLPETPYAMRKQMAYMGKDLYGQLLDIRKAGGEDTEVQKGMYFQILENPLYLSIKDLAVNGEDLKLLGYRKGEAIGKALEALFEAVLEVPERNTRKDLLDLARKLEKESDAYEQ